MYKIPYTITGDIMTDEPFAAWHTCRVEVNVSSTMPLLMSIIQNSKTSLASIEMKLDKPVKIERAEDV